MTPIVNGSPVLREAAAREPRTPDNQTRSAERGASPLLAFLPAVIGALAVSEVPPLGLACLGLAIMLCLAPFRPGARPVLAAFVLSAIPFWYAAGMTLFAMAFDASSDLETIKYRLIAAGFFLVPFVVAQSVRAVVRRVRRRRES